MENTVKPQKCGKKMILGVLAAVLALLLALAIAIFALWHNELFSMASMKLLRERDDSHMDGAVARRPRPGRSCRCRTPRLRH